VIGRERIYCENHGDPLLVDEPWPIQLSSSQQIFSIQKVKNRGLVLKNHVLSLHIAFN
jgi:hypothetical protein